MKIAILLGTRPEIIKFSPIIREFQKRKVEFFVIHTNQHYSYEMDKIFFEELHLPLPKYNLNIGSGSHAQQTGKMLIQIEDILQNEKPTILMVQGDTNTVLAGALAACKLEIKVAHVEAGLRSFDRRMPEEYNRILADHISTFLFAPTEIAIKNLENEGIGASSYLTLQGQSKAKLYNVGNTIIDATLQNLEIAKKNERKVLAKYGVNSNEYILLTAHRAENVDNIKFLQNLCKFIEYISTKHKLKVIWPIHPRTVKKLAEFDLTPNAVLVDPIGYIEFLALESNAKITVTDSGGVQEETCVLKTPCVTVRLSTDRPETVITGSNAIGKTDFNSMKSAFEKMLKAPKNWKLPYAANSSAKIVDVLQKEEKL